jgi:hypothetical protein
MPPALYTFPYTISAYILARSTEKDKILSDFYHEGRITPDRLAFFRVYFLYPSARRAFSQPLAEGRKGFAVALGPELHVAGIQIPDPTDEAEGAGLAARGVAESDSLYSARDYGVKGG